MIPKHLQSAKQLTSSQSMVDYKTRRADD